MKTQVIISMLVLIVLSTSCKKELTVEFDKMVENRKKEKAGNINSLSDAKINQSFDWKTLKDINLTVTGYANSQVVVTTLDGKTIDVFRVRTNEPYTTALNLPTAEKSIVLNYMGQQVVVEVSGQHLNYVFN